MTVDELLSIMQQLRLMQSESEALAFDQAVVALASLPAEHVQERLGQLFLAFDDDTHHLEVMWGLVHLIESFGVEVTLIKIDEVAPALLERAHDWVSLIIGRIMYSDPDWATFKAHFPNVSLKHRTAICALLNEITADYEAKRLEVNEVMCLDGLLRHGVQ